MKADLHFSSSTHPVGTDVQRILIQHISTRGRRFLFVEELGGEQIVPVKEARDLYTFAVEEGLKVSFETAAVRDALTPKHDGEEVYRQLVGE